MAELTRNSPFGELLSFDTQFFRVTCKTRERSRPESNSGLIRDQTNDIQANTYMPIVLGMDTKPAESDAKSDDGKANQNVRAPRAEVRKRAEDQEHNDLQSKGDAIAQQDDRVDGSSAS